MTDLHRALGACCVYKVTHIASGKAYIGKTTESLEKYIRHRLIPRKNGILGRAIRKHGRAAFRSEILLVGSEDFCFRDVIDGERGGMERRLIAAYGTQKQNGYNIGEGGEGWSRKDHLRWRESPAGRAAYVRCNEEQRRLTGYIRRRVLEALQAAESVSLASLTSSLNLTNKQVGTAILLLRRVEGYNIVREGRWGARRYRLYPNKEEAGAARAREESRLFNEGPGAWDGVNHGQHARLAGYPQRRVLGALLTSTESISIPSLASSLNLTNKRVCQAIGALRTLKGHNIISKHVGPFPAKYQLIINSKHQPWAHLGIMDWRAAHDDRE